MTMKRPVFTLILLLAGSLPAAEPITDPLRDYLENFDVRRGESVITADPDLNGDGIADLLITRNTLSNGRQGNLWVCYESMGAGSFRRIDELAEGNPIEFHQKAVSFRPRRDGKGLELIRYSPGGAGEGMLSSLKLSGGGATETILEDLRPSGEPDRYTSLFENPKSQLAFHWEKSDVLLARYFPLGRWFLHMTPLKWAIAVLGALATLVLVLALVRVFLGGRAAPAVPR